ncbi:MAG: hypothetical protein ACPGVP_14785, partial [Thiolinea sp.]
MQDFGWTGEKGYFVLAAPDAWLVTVLPPLTPVPTSLHQRANQLVKQLQAQQFVRTGIDPAFFLVAPSGDVFLLGTLLHEDVQRLQADSGLLMGEWRQQTSSTVDIKKWLGWLLFIFTGLAIASGTYINRDLIFSVQPQSVNPKVSKDIGDTEDSAGVAEKHTVVADAGLAIETTVIRGKPVTTDSVLPGEETEEKQLPNTDLQKTYPVAEPEPEP